MAGSPFPGMDPYLEGEMWQEFHDRLANQISAQLMPLLQPKYVALLSKYFVTQEPLLGIGAKSDDQGFYPDVHVSQVKEVVATYSAGTPVEAIEMITPMPAKAPILSVEIRDVAKRRLVTAIEILSSANKRGRGFKEYIKKRIALFKTRTHLLEIDLLRAGKRIPLLGDLPPASYYLYLSRFTRRPRTQVWPVQLRDCLPTIPVPLLPPDPDVALDLQAAVNACFALVGYERLLDYTAPPPPPDLSPEDAAWVKTQLVRVQPAPLPAT